MRSRVWGKGEEFPPLWSHCLHLHVCPSPDPLQTRPFGFYGGFIPWCDVLTNPLAMKVHHQPLPPLSYGKEPVPYLPGKQWPLGGTQHHFLSPWLCGHLPLPQGSKPSSPSFRFLPAHFFVRVSAFQSKCHFLGKVFALNLYSHLNYASSCLLRFILDSVSRNLWLFISLLLLGHKYHPWPFVWAPLPALSAACCVMAPMDTSGGKKSLQKCSLSTASKMVFCDPR